MHFVIFGHATLWRGLIKSLARRHHTVTFYEKDAPYYANTRDGWQQPAGVAVRLCYGCGAGINP